jgi:predicted molibdopterin-dependent oxidoreductase YjgC
VSRPPDRISPGQFRRVAERERRRITLTLNGIEIDALEGDTVLTAILTVWQHLRIAEFTEAPRAGFCLMGACQDCWVATADGRALRACTTYLAEGMAIVTRS